MIFSLPARFRALNFSFRPTVSGLLGLACVAFLAVGVTGSTLVAQAPLLLPNTFSTVAGSTNGSGTSTGFTVGSACSTGSPFTATDIYGDGCLATQAVFGPDFMDGIHVDGQGNLWITDYDNNWSGSSVSMIRKVDAKTGVISLVVGNAYGNSGNICAAATATSAGAMDANGDGCLLSAAKAQKDRGYGMDPYGNFFTGSYSSGEVRIFCNAVSPLCPIAAGVTQTYSSAQKQVGYSYRIAGCVATGSGATSSATSTTAGTAGDGYFASAFWNLPGDVTAWGTSNSSFSATAGITGTAGTCGSTTGEINGSRGVTADQYGNVYISDGSNVRLRVVVGPPTFTLPSGTTLTNPLPAVIALNPTYASVTASQMYGRIYPIVGGFGASTKNAACAAGSSAGYAYDTYGDACPWYNTTVAASNPLGLTIDTTTEGGVASSNLVFTDTSAGNIRVLYMGPTVAVGNITSTTYPMANAILLNNIPTTVLTQVKHGFVYLLAGNGSTGPSASTGAPVLGSTANIQQGWTRIASGPSGNFFATNTSGTADAVLMYDLSGGTVREFIKSATGANLSSVTLTGIGTYTNYAYCPTLGQGDGTAQFSTTGTYSAATVTGSACFNGSGTGSSTQGVAVDSSNNLYLTDDEVDSSGNPRSRIRKVLASQLYPATMGTPITQVLRIHGAPGTAAGATAIAATAFNAPSSEISVATPVCATTADAGNAVDCLATVTFNPAAPGTRNASLALTDSSLSSSATFPLDGISTGSALVADPTALGAPTTTNVLSTATTPTPTGVAVDTNGDVFTMDTFAHKFTEISSTGTVTQLSGTLPSNPTQITLDPSGNLWATGSGTSGLVELALGATGTYTPASVTISGVSAPQAIAFDQKGNLYVADQATTSVFEVAAATVSGTILPNIPGIQSYEPIVTIATGLTTPTALAIDGNGTLYIADTGANAILRIDGKTGAKTTFASGIHPAGLAADTAGDLYYQDSTSKKIIEFPYGSIASGVAGSSTITVFTSLTTPSGLAVTGTGNLYSADQGAGALNLISRNSLTYNFGTTTGTVFGAMLTNVGNLAATGYAEIDAAEFPISSGSSNGCGTVPSTANTFLPGAFCTLTSTFVPASGSVAVAGTTSLLAAASTTGSLILQGTENSGSNPTTTASVSGTTNTAVYTPSGTELSYTVSIAASDFSAVTGYVNVTIDSGTAVKYNLNTGAPATITIPLSGLTVGTHTFSAIYPSGQGNDLQSNTASQSFTITQASTTVFWTPSVTTQQFSAAVGASVLNATATITGTSTAVPGYFVYSATPSGGGTTTNLHAASFLAIGSYILGVSFLPLDSVNYAGTTGTVSSYTVTKASTTAPVGGTLMLVAADGTGNYTSIQTALNALPNTGGSIYIKPGTYTGFVTVNKPNTAMRGLGGNPAKVIITNEDGAFSPPYLTGQGPGNNGSTGDEGSATLVIANSTVNGFSSNPNYFYAENLSVLNTWDTDSTNSDQVRYLGGSTCADNQTPTNNLALYTAGQLCASQALAVWITSDLAVVNNVYFSSKQDTIYAGSQGGSPKNPGRQYYFRGKVTGDVDYIFGDAAAVFDYTSIFTDFHGSVTGATTIEAQNKSVQTGASGDYLSGYIMNNDVFTSQQSGMTQLAYGRPYGMYSTYIMLNSYVDQIGTAGWTEFTGDTNLPTSTYGQYNTIPYTDPATGSVDLDGVTYLGAGGSTGQGVGGTFETTSQSPGTPMANNAVKTTLTVGQATLYYPNAFLGTTVNTSTTGVTNWVPTTALATDINGFVPSATSATINSGTPITILMHPQTPGLGAVTNGNYTIPTGTYTLTDSYKNASNITTSSTLATGSLDAAGEAYFTSSTLAAGTHSLTWTYSGDSNFNGSSSTTPYVITINSLSSTTTLAITTNPIAYGQSANVTATVSGSGTEPTGNVTLTTDTTSNTQTSALSSGAVNFVVAGLAAGSHTESASYAGDSNYTASTSSGMTLTVNKASLAIMAICANRLFDQPNTCSGSASGYQYADNATNVLSAGPSASTTATAVSSAGTYTVTPAATLSTFGATNYTLSPTNGSFAVTGGVPQNILPFQLPNFVHGGTYQLVAHATSGLPVSYAVTVGSGIASVSGTTLTVSGTGTVTITASQGGNGNYAAATSVDATFTAQ